MLSALEPGSVSEGQQLLMFIRTSLCPTWQMVGSALGHPAVFAVAVDVIFDDLSKFNRGMKRHQWVESAELGNG